MAAITVQPQGTGMTLAAASGGGDTVVGNVMRAGGWGPNTVLVVTVGATPTIVTIDGVAQASVTSATAVYPISGGVYSGRAVPVTYNQVTSVTVGAQVL
jgi:hypothetical protein